MHQVKQVTLLDTALALKDDQDRLEVWFNSLSEAEQGLVQEQMLERVQYLLRDFTTVLGVLHEEGSE